MRDYHLNKLRFGRMLEHINSKAFAALRAREAKTRRGLEPETGPDTSSAAGIRRGPCLRRSRKKRVATPPPHTTRLITAAAEDNCSGNSSPKGHTMTLSPSTMMAVGAIAILSQKDHDCERLLREIHRSLPFPIFLRFVRLSAQQGLHGPRLVQRHHESGTFGATIISVFDAHTCSSVDCQLATRTIIETIRHRVTW